MPEQSPDEPEQPAEQRNDSAVLRAVWVRWRLRVAIAIATLVVLVLVVLCAEAFLTRGLAATNVRLADVDVSRASPAEIAARCRQLEQRLLARKLRLRLEGAALELEPAAIGFRLNHAQTVERVLAEGRNRGWFGRLAGVAARAFRPATVQPAVELDRAALSALITRWQDEALADRPLSGGIRVAGRDVQALYPKGGRGVDEADAERLLRAALSATAPGELSLPVTTLPAPLGPGAVDAVAAQARRLLAADIELTLDEPQRSLLITPETLGAALLTRRDDKRLLLEVDGAALAKALDAERTKIELEAQDARFVIDARDQITITPSSSGLRIDFAALPAAIQAAAERRKGALPVRREPEPALTTAQAEGLGVKGLVSSFTTRHACCERRVDNIHRIADLLDGLVVRPGQTVSLNEVVGPRTKKNGFVLAPTIEEGEFVDTLGGGISQFATTIFNALFHGGYDIVERQPHTYWFPRYPEGHEATLSWPKPDLIFRNDTEAGLVIDTSYSGTTITVKLYGDNGGRKVRAHVSARSNITHPELELVANPALEPNREKVKESGAVGWSIIVSRVLTLADGTTREEKRKVTYKPKPRRVEVHPCRIPKGEKGYTGERCPEPKDAEMAAPDDEQQENADGAQ
jgi:vancomycin resistance protein YoaR